MGVPLKHKTAEYHHIADENAFSSNNDPWDNPTVKPKTSRQDSFFSEHIKQYVELISWARWYPDLFLDLIKPQKGGINLHFDQRVYLRCICRFAAVYGVFPRRLGKNSW